MSKRRLVITAVLAGATQSEAARRYGVTQGWISRLMARYDLEGEAAFEPRSRRPHSSPNALNPEIVELILQLRTDLATAGLDAGPETIAWHLTHHHNVVVSRATISRHLTKAGLVTPEEAPEVRLRPLRSTNAERDLAIRLHPLPTHPPRRSARTRRRDHQLAR